MSLYVGTSGFAYKAWKGSFYPGDLPEQRMLRYYGEHFRAVEINSTFYRMPSVALLDAWAGEVPTHFKFVLKASQRITHQRRLLDADEDVGYRLADATRVFQQSAEVVAQHGASVACGQALQIDAFGRVEAAACVEQPAEVGGAAPQCARSARERSFIRVLRRLGIGFFQRRAVAEPFFSISLRLFPAVADRADAARRVSFFAEADHTAVSATRPRAARSGPGMRTARRRPRALRAG